MKYILAFGQRNTPNPTEYEIYDSRNKLIDRIRWLQEYGTREQKLALNDRITMHRFFVIEVTTDGSCLITKELTKELGLRQRGYDHVGPKQVAESPVS